MQKRIAGNLKMGDLNKALEYDHMANEELNGNAYYISHLLLKMNSAERNRLIVSSH